MEKDVNFRKFAWNNSWNDNKWIYFVAGFSYLEPLWSSLQALVCSLHSAGISWQHQVFREFWGIWNPKNYKLLESFPIFFLKWLIQTSLDDFYTNLEINEVRCIRLQIKKIDLICIYWLSSTQFQLSHKISFCNVLDLSICRSWINSVKNRHLFKLIKKKIY